MTPTVPAPPAGAPTLSPTAATAGSRPGRRRREPPANDGYPESVYLRYLPGIYRQDPFIRRLLLIFESVMLPLERVIDTLPLYTEPEMAPEELLPWLAQWVALSLDGAWPVERQRALIADAAEIYRWRGTKRGLKRHIAAYTGLEPVIQESQGGFVLGRESGLGWTTQLTVMPHNPLLFIVTVPVDNPRAVDPEVLRAIIEEDKPAHAVYRLRVARALSAQPRGTLAHPPQNL
jgi:phage tail-like protein